MDFELDNSNDIDDIKNRVRDLELEIENLSSNGKFLYSFYKRGLILKTKLEKIESDYNQKQINKKVYEYKLLNLIEPIYEFKTSIEPFSYFDKLNYIKLMEIFEYISKKIKKGLPDKFLSFLEKFF